MPPVASSPPASVGVAQVAVVSVPTVTASVTAVQTVPLLPQSLPPGLPHAVAQPPAAISAFPPVMVPPFRVPLPGMHIPLPGTYIGLFRALSWHQDLKLLFNLFKHISDTANIFTGTVWLHA